jgi:hypothetical protein
VSLLGATNFELGAITALADFYKLCIATASLLQKIADIGDVLWLKGQR